MNEGMLESGNSRGQGHFIKKRVGNGLKLGSVPRDVLLIFLDQLVSRLCSIYYPYSVCSGFCLRKGHTDQLWAGQEMGN